MKLNMMTMLLFLGPERLKGNEIYRDALLMKRVLELAVFLRAPDDILDGIGKGRRYEEFSEFAYLYMFDELVSFQEV